MVIGEPLQAVRRTQEALSLFSFVVGGALLPRPEGYKMDKLTSEAFKDLREMAQTYEANGEVGRADVCLETAKRLEDEWEKENKRFLAMMERVKNAKPEAITHPADDERPGY